MLAIRRFSTVLTLLFLSSFGFSPSLAFGQQGTFFPTGSMNTGRFAHTATLLNNGLVLITGGQNSQGDLSGAELYHPTTGTFAPAGNMTIGRAFFTATLLNDGRVLIAGGATNFNPLGTASAELYDPSTGLFTATGSMNGGSRIYHTATLLKNGKVLITGGTSDGDHSILASAELYDPATGIFTPTGSMTTGRQLHTATLLNNGLVLVAGGTDANGAGNIPVSADLYDPATGVFTGTGNMTANRQGQTATLLNNGTVLIVGGDFTYQTAELYDPTSGTFITTGSMAPPARINQTATLLNKGQVLIAGGETPTLQRHPLSSAELYDPATGSFIITGNMTTTRADHTATILNDGKVLIAGGVGGLVNSNLSSAELYEMVFVSPQSLTFSDQVIGTTSAVQTVTLTNNESTALSITTVSISGANASDFTETDNCVGSLAAGASCLIKVTFTPAATGTRMAALAIANNLSGSPIPVPLTGTGIAATRIVSLSANSLTFASVMLGASEARSLTLSNTGNTMLSISGVAITGVNASDFSETDTCGGSVAAGGFCTINVTFTPTATGTRTGTLRITDDATSPPSPQTVALSGTGQDFSMASTPQSATVAAGQTASYTVSVSPGGGFNQTVSLACTGAPALAVCSVSPSSVAMNGSTASSVTVTVTTTAFSLILPEFRMMGPPHTLNVGLMLLLSFLLILALRASLIRQSRDRKHSLVVVISLVLLLCTGIALVACGGGGASVPPKPGTPPGNYSLTVSGTFTSGSTTVTHNTKLTLLVQ